MIEIGNRIETPEGVFYELEYGGEGNIYKNEDAFLNRPDEVCYVPEYAAEDREDWRVSESSDGCFTHNSLLALCKGNDAYSAETFQEEGAWYTTHIWMTGEENLSFECSFTVSKGGDKHPAEEIIRSLQIRKEGVSHPREIIPIRVLEIGEVNTAFEWASTAIKKQLTKDFTASESDIDSIQQVMDSGRFQTQQRMAWENFGIAFGAILVNEMEGMEWVTVIEGQKEYPALQFMCSDMVLDPAALVWGKAKKGLPCDLKSEFRKIKREAEAVLDDLNK